MQAILGLQYGDEGKGKVVDLLMEDVDICARFNGGNNAGHTIKVGGVKYALHLLPSGIIRPKTKNFLGGGVVCHIKSLLNEASQFDEDILQRLYISDRCGILLDLHIIADQLEESERAHAVGTTKKGIGPAYADLIARRGVRMGDMKLPQVFAQKVRALYTRLKFLYPNSPLVLNYDVQAEIDQHLSVYLVTLESRIVNGPQFIRDGLDSGEKILCEGANATMLDIQLGTYPYVTSSITSVGGICSGLGVPHSMILPPLGIVKAYTTRVGDGPFVTELNDQCGARLQQAGKEFGTTTGRPRRCGWFDVPMLRYTAWSNGCKDICLTKLDVLSGFSVIKVCTTYKWKESGDLLPPNYVPSAAEMLEIEPVYIELPGWQEDITGCTSYDDLPLTCQKYVAVLEEYVGVFAKYISVGPERNQTIYRGD